MIKINFLLMEARFFVCILSANEGLGTFLR